MILPTYFYKSIFIALMVREKVIWSYNPSWIPEMRRDVITRRPASISNFLLGILLTHLLKYNSY